MDERVDNVLRRLEREDTEERAGFGLPGEVPHEERMYTLHPESSKLVHMLVQASGGRKVLEIGASHGYSTVVLADAARITGGQLTSLEISEDNVRTTTANVAEAGLSDHVTVIHGDAMATIADVAGPLGFILLDCWEDVYVPLYPHIIPLLRPGGLLVTDNVTAGEPGTADFVRTLEADPIMETVNVPIGRDIQVSAKRLDARD